MIGICRNPTRRRMQGYRNRFLPKNDEFGDEFQERF